MTFSFSSDLRQFCSKIDLIFGRFLFVFHDVICLLDLLSNNAGERLIVDLALLPESNHSLVANTIELFV
jgi:hypothetical protein